MTETIRNDSEFKPQDIEQFQLTPLPENIPLPDGWKNIPIEPNDEPLVAVGINSDYPIYTDSIYARERDSSPYKDGVPGSLVTVFLRAGLADTLRSVESRLPFGLHIIVIDGYRPIEVQQALYETYFDALHQVSTGLTNEQLANETQHYVSLPSSNPNNPSPHNTGGSIDIALFKMPIAVEGRVKRIDEQLTLLRDPQQRSKLQVERYNLLSQYGRLLNFGSQMDEGTDLSRLDFFETEAKRRELSPSEIEAMKNRRLLYHLMTGPAGLQPYKNEWWHYNSPLSQMGAKTAGLPVAIYGPASLSDENRLFEARRQDLAARLIRHTYISQYAVIKPKTSA